MEKEQFDKIMSELQEIKTRIKLLEDSISLSFSPVTFCCQHEWEVHPTSGTYCPKCGSYNSDPYPVTLTAGG